MSTVEATDAQLVALVQRALENVLDQRREWLAALIAEAVEDAGLVNAIRDGEASETIDREAVFKLLEA